MASSPGGPEATIVGHVDVGGHVEYILDVAVAGQEGSWRVQRRYRRFLELHSRLRPYYGDALPAFPEKRRFFGMGKLLFGSQSEDFIVERADALQEYLQGVLSLEPAAAPPILRQFLGLEAASSEAATPTSRRTHWLVHRGLGSRAGAVARPEPLEYSTVEVFEVAVAVATAAGAVAARRLRAASPAAAEGLRRLLPALLDDKKSLLVCGGSSASAQDFAQRLCPETGAWEALPQMRLPRRACAAASVEGRCYLVGGVDTLAVVAEKSDAMLKHISDNWSEYFDPVTSRWEMLGPAGPGFTHASAVASGGFVYVFGGLSSGGALNYANRLDPAKRLWRSLKPMPTPRFECAAASLSGQLYVVGGASSSGEPLAVAESFDPSVGKWTPGMPPMGCARFGCAAAAVGGRIFVIGGHCRGESLANVESFDPRPGRWEAMAPLPVARHRCGAAAVAGSIYVFGGSDGQRDLDSVDRLDVKASHWEAGPPMPRSFGRCCAVAVAS